MNTVRLAAKLGGRPLPPRGCLYAAKSNWEPIPPATLYGRLPGTGQTLSFGSAFGQFFFAHRPLDIDGALCA